VDNTSLAGSLLIGNEPVNSTILFAKAKKLACNSTVAATAGNSVTLFALLVLQQILAQQALNPVSNLNNIIDISNAISNLNTSLTVLDVVNVNS
jgi:hypothetical protein